MTTRINTSAFKASLAVAAALILGVLLAAGTAFADAGDLDRSFGKDGRVTTDLGGYDGVADVVSQPDGKIVAGGFSRVGSGYDPALVRYNRNGSLDKTFGGGDGTVVMPDLRRDLGGGAMNVAVQPDGKIVAAGGGSRGFALARFNPDGTLDTTFGEDGLVTTDFGDEPEDYDSVHDLKVQPDGRIVAAGKLSDQFALARFNPDGTPDTTFGEDGAVSTDFGGEPGVKAAATSLALHPDGRIVAGGVRGLGFGGDPVGALARFNPDGTPDATFGEDGKVTTDFPGNVGGISDLVLQPDGKPVVAGGYRVFLLARFNPDGTPDTSFGGDGVVTTNFRGGLDSAASLVLQPDGKIVAGGDSTGGETYVFALARYNRNGSLDRSFGADGRVTTHFGKENEAVGGHLALQPDGRLVAAGATYFRNYDRDFALARYTTE